MDLSTRNWLVTTVAGFVCLGVWLLSSTASPIFVLDGAVSAALFGIAVGALGLSQYAGYKAINVVDEISRD